MLEARFAGVKRGRQGEDRLAVLNGGDPAGRERPPVPQPLHGVDERHRRVPWPDEVRVQRVHRPVGRDGPARRDERLARHLAAEDTLPALILRAAAAEHVLLDLLQIEQRDQPVERSLHDEAGSSPGWSPARLVSSSGPSGPGPSGVLCTVLPGVLRTVLPGVLRTVLPGVLRTTSAHSSSTAAPYRSSLTAPMPGMAASSARLPGRASAIAWSVASENTTYAGTLCSRAVSSRHSRSRRNIGSSARAVGPAATPAASAAPAGRAAWRRAVPPPPRPPAPFLPTPCLPESSRPVSTPDRNLDGTRDLRPPEALASAQDSESRSLALVIPT